MSHRFIAAACAVAALALVPAGASAAGTGAIHPGVQTFTDGAQCTANFIYSDGTNTYIGQAAHCSGTGGNTATDGCTSGTLPVGTQVQVTGANKPGVMVYNSWATMQANGEKDADTCAYNDIALIKLDPADAANVDPTVPGWGGPTGVASLPSTAGSKVYTYGNSELRGGVTQLSPKTGVVVDQQPSGWSTDVYTATPGIPGDSGSGFMTDTGAAAGILSTVQLAPLAGSNGVGDLPRELNYMHTHGGPNATVVNGTKPFQPSLTAAIVGIKTLL
jgi:hypothetical protein